MRDALTLWKMKIFIRGLCQLYLQLIIFQSIDTSNRIYIYPAPQITIAFNRDFIACYGVFSVYFCRSCCRLRPLLLSFIVWLDNKKNSRNRKATRRFDKAKILPRKHSFLVSRLWKHNFQYMRNHSIYVSSQNGRQEHSIFHRRICTANHFIIIAIYCYQFQFYYSNVEENAPRPHTTISFAPSFILGYMLCIQCTNRFV